jgi:hypothetical protein
MAGIQFGQALLPTHAVQAGLDRTSLAPLSSSPPSRVHVVTTTKGTVHIRSHPERLTKEPSQELIFPEIPVSELTAEADGTVKSLLELNSTAILLVEISKCC